MSSIYIARENKAFRASHPCPLCDKETTAHAVDFFSWRSNNSVCLA
ncbi:hypothetical protein ACFU51_05590 [Streptomyces sp. NPDC057430]